MGLDMYLEAQLYVGAGKLNGSIETEYGNKANLPDMPISYVKYDVSYWRKAYAIHSWICDRVGEVEDGGYVHVPVDELKDLLGIAVKVLAPYELFLQAQKNKDPNAKKFYDKAVEVAKELLPDDEAPGYEYEEWYFEQVKSTVEQLDKVLKLCEKFPDISIFYTANW